MNKQSEQMKFIIDNLNIEQQEHLEFYKTKLENKILELSPSALKKLIDEPLTYFNEYVCGDYDNTETQKQKRGTLIHTLILQPEEVKEKYSVMPEGLKIPEGQAAEVINFVVNNIDEKSSSYLGDHSEIILECMKEINYHQSLVDDKKDLTLTGDKKRLEKVLTSSNIAYFEHLLNSKGKEIITQSFYDECFFKAELLKRIKEKNRIIILDEDFEDVSYELELKTNYLGFLLKCIIDVLKIDVKAKKIFITDVKSLGGKLETVLKWDIEKYRYGIQAAINYLCVLELISTPEFKELVPEANKFTIEFGFLFVDGNNTTKYVYVSKPTMDIYIAELGVLLKTNVEYHLTTFDFSAPFKYLTQDVTL